VRRLCRHDNLEVGARAAPTRMCFASFSEVEGESFAATTHSVALTTESRQGCLAEECSSWACEFPCPRRPLRHVPVKLLLRVPKCNFVMHDGFRKPSGGLPPPVSCIADAGSEDLRCKLHERTPTVFLPRRQPITISLNRAAQLGTLLSCAAATRWS